MKNLTNYLKIIALAFCSVFTANAFSQIAVASSTGYAVNITLIPTTILPTSSTCTWGYNYNLRINYVVTFSGSNIPSNLYTLQGTVGCGPSAHFFSLPTSGGAGVYTTTTNQWTGMTNCSVATIASMNCNSASIRINGPGISDRTVNFSTYTVLPVTLVDFIAVRKDSGIQLDWSTVNELDNDYFTIERSVDDMNWVAIETKAGAGTSVQQNNYSFTDGSNLSGRISYRIKQTDFSGNSTYSKTAVVAGITRLETISVFPIPNTGNTISVSGIHEFNKYRIAVYSVAGIKMGERGLTSSSLTLPSLQPGMYLLQFIHATEGIVKTIRYIKL